MFLYKVKQIAQSLFHYPKIQLGADYDRYWETRGLGAELNSFQRTRADLILGLARPGSSMLDIGGGDGRILSYLKTHGNFTRLVNVDISSSALAVARKNGIEIIEDDITRPEVVANLPPADYILLLEVIEHIPRSEELLRAAFARAGKGVFFSVPNTGFVAHRLRLLLGRFPLQWRINPSEHLRFWTAADLRSWLKDQNYSRHSVYLYEGLPWLGRLWPALFAEGIFVYLPKANF